MKRRTRLICMISILNVSAILMMFELFVIDDVAVPRDKFDPAPVSPSPAAAATPAAAASAKSDAKPYSIYNQPDSYTQYAVKHLGLKPFLDVKALQPDMGDVVNDVFSLQYRMNSARQCDSSSAGPTLMVVVISAPDHFERRKSARQTWARQMLQSRSLGVGWARIVFLIGLTKDPETTQRLMVEQEHNNDLVQLSIVDNYSKLTLKSVAMLHWVWLFCRKAHFILKVDDDVYVNVNNIISTIETLPIHSKSIYGVGVNIWCQRNPAHKHFVSRQIWPWTSYPRFVAGGAYLVTGVALRSMLSAIQTTPFFPYEDVYMNGICADKANVSRFAAPRMFVAWIPNNDDIDACLVRNTTMWQTKSVEQATVSHNVTTWTFRHRRRCHLGQFKDAPLQLNKGHAQQFEPLENFKEWTWKLT